ncbi:unnamed protein product [Caenorhabditis brenneri]
MSGSSSPSPTPSRSPSPSRALNDTIRSMLETPAKKEQFDLIGDNYKSAYYLAAVSEAKVGHFKTDAVLYSNAVEDIEGTLLMSDVATIKRVFSDDPAPLSIAGIGWSIYSILNKQVPNGRFQTTCFNVNVCLKALALADIKKMDESFTDFSGSSSDRIFDRKYLLLPVSFDKGAGLTLILNGSKRKQVYHFQIGSTPDWEDKVVPKIFCFLRKFLELPRYNYSVDPLAKAEVHVVKLDSLGATERAFQMLYILRQITKMAENKKHPQQKMKSLSQLNENKEEFEEGIIELRKFLSGDLEKNLNSYVRGNPVGILLRERRQYLEERDAAKKTEEREAIQKNRPGPSEKRSSGKIAETPKRKFAMKRKRAVLLEDDDSDNDDVVTERVKTPRAAKSNASKKRAYFDCDDSSKENDSD